MKRLLNVSLVVLIGLITTLSVHAANLTNYSSQLNASSDSTRPGSGEIHMMIVMNDYNKDNPVDGWLVEANKQTKVILIGDENLNEKTFISFTSNNNPLCSQSNLFKIEVLEQNVNQTYAQAFIQLPPFPPRSIQEQLVGHLDMYHMCIMTTNGSFHQPVNMLSQSRIIVFQEMFPVWMKIGFSIIGFIASFYLSGLVLGIMAIDITDLLILIKAGTPTQKDHAKELLPIRKNGNRILCTLLLSNVAANSLVTVFLNNLIDSGWQTFVVSTLTLCLIGEIIPQAVFNRHGFILAAKSVFFIKFLLNITAPFAYPIGLLLDKVLGAEAGMAYTRKQMRQLIELQYETGKLKLHETEMHILQSALAMQKTQVESLMIRISKVFMIDFNSRLDFDNISAIMSSGFTRIPVFKNDRSNIIGVINVKDLALINPCDNMSLEAFRSCYKTDIVFVPQDLSIIKLLQEFIKGKSHLAFVYRRTSAIENQNEIDGSSDKEEQQAHETKTRRKRTTSNLSASLRLEYFLCNSTQFKNKSLDNHDGLNDINENENLMRKQSLVGDSGIFVVTGNEELPEVFSSAMKHIIGIITLEDIFELILQEKIFDEKDLDPATLKSSQRDFTMLTQTSGHKLPIYDKTLYAAYQFLSSNLEAFNPLYLPAPALQNLLRSNLHSFTPAVDAFELKLYRQNIRANYFIMIISGTGDVNIGKENMKFSAQTFTYFGLQAILGDQEIKKDTINIDACKEIKFVPDFSLTLRKKCVYVKLTRQAYIEAMRAVKEKRPFDSSVSTIHENYRSKIISGGAAKIKKLSNAEMMKKKLSLTQHSRSSSHGNTDIIAAMNNNKASESQYGTDESTNLNDSEDETIKAYLLSHKV